MKRAVFIFTVLAAFGSAGQTAPTGPAAPTTPSGGLPASPTTPGLPASPTERGLPTQPRPGLPGFTNTAGILAPTNRFGTNQFGNVTAADFGPLLLNLQDNLQQLLPLLASINNNIALGNVAATNVGVGVTNLFTGLGTTPTVGVNFSGNTSADLSSGRGVNLGANFATSPGAVSPAPTGALGANAATGSLFPPSPTGATNTIGLPPGLPLNTPLENTNSVATSGDLQTANALLILQSDIQRLLPLVAALNGGSLDLAALMNNLGSITNAVATNAFGTPPERLVPVGPSRLLAPTTVPGTTVPASQP